VRSACRCNTAQSICRCLVPCERRYRDRRRPAEHRKTPKLLWRDANPRRQRVSNLERRHWNHLRRDRQCRVHRHAKRAMLLALSVRRVRKIADVCSILRQPLSVNMYGLRRAHRTHQQYEQQRQHAYPLGLRAGDSSALEFLSQEFWAKESLDKALPCPLDAGSKDKDARLCQLPPTIAWSLHQSKLPRVKRCVVRPAQKHCKPISRRVFRKVFIGDLCMFLQPLLRRQRFESGSQFCVDVAPCRL
jgi:hypothetical protein